MISYLFFLFVCACVIYKVIFMLKHPFWSRQPVFHFHKLWLWFMTDQVITQEFTVIKKYYDTQHISHYNSYDFPKEYTSELVDFVKDNYLREKSIDYIPSENGIMKYFVGHNERVSICLYKAFVNR